MARKKVPPKVNTEEIQAQMAMIKPMLAGMRVTFKVKAGSGIVSKYASQVDGDTITLVEMDFDKMVQKPNERLPMRNTAQKVLCQMEYSR